MRPLLVLLPLLLAACPAAKNAAGDANDEVLEAPAKPAEPNKAAPAPVPPPAANPNDAAAKAPAQSPNHVLPQSANVVHVAKPVPAKK